MAVGPVNQALLDANYQEPGETYLDTKTEGAFQVVVNQVNENAGIFSAGGSALIVSDPITGVTGANVYDQLVSIEAQVQAAVGGIVPPSTITNAMLQTDSVDNRVLAGNAVGRANLTAEASVGNIAGIIYAYKNLGGF